jgi:hypothetical protein
MATHSVSHVLVFVLETIAKGIIDPCYLRHLFRIVIKRFKKSRFVVCVVYFAFHLIRVVRQYDLFRLASLSILIL